MRHFLSKKLGGLQFFLTMAMTMTMTMTMIPQVLIADNDDTGSEVPTDTDHQEDAGSRQGADQ